MKGILVGVVAAVVLVLAGYFLYPGLFQNANADSNSSREEKLVDRVELFWKLRQSNDWARIYSELMEPSIKEKESLTDFVQTRGVIQYLSHRIEDVKISGDKAKVTCSIEVKINHPTANTMKYPYMDSVVKDDWLWIEGSWYRKYESKGFQKR